MLNYTILLPWAPHRDAWKLENWAEFQESIRVARSLSNMADVVV